MRHPPDQLGVIGIEQPFALFAKSPDFSAPLKDHSSGAEKLAGKKNWQLAILSGGGVGEEGQRLCTWFGVAKLGLNIIWVGELFSNRPLTFKPDTPFPLKFLACKTY